jgi:hypothetical protein
MTDSGRTFDPASVADLDEPVRRSLRRVLDPGTQLAAAWRLGMKGSIRVGLKLPFEATQELDGSFFVWRARVPSKRFRLLEVTDSYRGGESGMIGRMAGLQVFADMSPDAARSAATRAVMESTMAPATLLPETGAEWIATSENEIRFRRAAVPLSEEVTVRIDEEGQVLEVEAQRWRKEKDKPGKLIPFLCRFTGEQNFGGMTVPRKLIAGWVDGDFEPFFEARINFVEAISVP